MEAASAARFHSLTCRFSTFIFCPVLACSLYVASIFSQLSLSLIQRSRSIIIHHPLSMF